VVVVVTVGVTGAVGVAVPVGVVESTAVWVDRLLTALLTLLPMLVEQPATRHPATRTAIRMQSLLTERRISVLSQC
jgi:hypothetical protein